MSTKQKSTWIADLAHLQGMELDDEIIKLARRHNGEVVGSGMSLWSGQRDMQAAFSTPLRAEKFLASVERVTKLDHSNVYEQDDDDCEY